MSSPPRYEADYNPSLSDHYRQRTPVPPLPPVPPPVPTRITSENYIDQRYEANRPPLPQPPASLNEFGANQQPFPGYPTSSSSRRPLPSQPPSGPSPNLYSASPAGSIGRRSLPVPPPLTQTSTPLPPPRPTGRTLPSVPPSLPSIPSSLTSPSIPPVPTPPLRPLPQSTSSQSIHQRSTSSGSFHPSRPDYSEPIQKYSLYDSPVSVTRASSGSSQPTTSSPSRVPSQSYSTYSRDTSVQSRDSAYESFASLYIPESRLDELEENGTNLTLRPPSHLPPNSLKHGQDDGRRTPTLANWNNDLEPPNLAHLDIERRPRTSSQSTINAVDAALPSTPTHVPQRTLNHQRSFMASAASSNDVSFPTPHLSVGSGDLNVPGSSRQSLYSGHSTPYYNDSPVAGRSSQPTPVPFPEIHTNGDRRPPSQASSMHPSITSSDRRISAALSPSWQAIAQPPSTWVQTKLQIHQSHVDGEEYYDDDGSLRRPSAYEEDIIGDYEDGEEEEAEEVNEIRFFQPSFLSEAALQLRDRVQRSRQMKAGIAWMGSFTGRDIVVSDRLNIEEGDS